MVEQGSGTARDRRRRERSVWRTGLLLSVLVHLVFMLGSGGGLSMAALAMTWGMDS